MLGTIERALLKGHTLQPMGGGPPPAFPEGHAPEGLIRALAALFLADELLAGEPPPEEPAGLPNQDVDLDLDMEVRVDEDDEYLVSKPRPLPMTYLRPSPHPLPDHRRWLRPRLGATNRPGQGWPLQWRTQRYPTATGPTPVGHDPPLWARQAAACGAPGFAPKC